jgi:hypothetical protein
MWTLALLFVPVAALVQTEPPTTERLIPRLVDKLSADAHGFQAPGIRGAQQPLLQTRGAQRAWPVLMGRKGRPSYSAGMQGGGQQMQQRPPGPPADGSSIFYLYCRSAPGKPWYPVSAMKGDGQSKGLINAWLSSPIAKGVFKERLDQGMARSIYDSERRLAEMAVQQQPLLKKDKARLEWGFKILDKDVAAKEAAGEIEEQTIVVVNKEMTKNVGIMNQAQDAFSGFAKQLKGETDSDAKTSGGILDQAKEAMSGLTKQIGGETGALPAGWTEAVDPNSGRTYYANAATGQSQWERPE